MISKSQKTVSASKNLHTIGNKEVLANIFHDTVEPDVECKDSRRRLEDKIEATRLMRDMQEFDFELDS